MELRLISSLLSGRESVPSSRTALQRVICFISLADNARRKNNKYFDTDDGKREREDKEDGEDSKEWKERRGSEVHPDTGAEVADDGAVRTFERSAEGGEGKGRRGRVSTTSQRLQARPRRTVSQYIRTLRERRTGRGQSRHGGKKETNGVPLASLPKLSLAITCPHGSSIGGFAAVDCSFETGQAKTEW